MMGIRREIRNKRLGFCSPHYGFAPQEIIDLRPNNALQTVTGQVTGSKTKILGSNSLLVSTVFYDDRYRPIKTISDNHVGGRDIMGNTYRNVVSPLVISSYMVHTTSLRPGVQLTVKDDFTYDHMDRLLTVDQEIQENGNIVSPQREIVSNSYNELGELSTKNLGAGIQNVDYTYNIRGWLTNINDVDAIGTDKFAMNLKYDDAFAGQQYNGNIAMMRWKVNGGTGQVNDIQRYLYSYDPLSRLTAARYTNDTKLDHFNVSNIIYDPNGNILSLSRSQSVNNQAKVIDQLTYDYGTNGNQLVQVTYTR